MGQVEGIYPGGSSKYDVYVDSDLMKSKLNAMGESAKSLTIKDEAFKHAEQVEKSDSILLLNCLWKDIQKMSNRYMTFMNIDVIETYSNVVDNTIKTAEITADALKIEGR